MDTKEYQKKYREANKEKQKEYQKKYREAKKEKQKEYQKKWYEQNKQKVLERQKEYHKDWYESNKEKSKDYYEANKQKVKDYYESNKQKVLERQKEYRQSESGRKANCKSKWKIRGLTDNDFDYIYNLYINTARCWVCSHDFSKYWKCMDHNHETGEFRQILCHNCNINDRWKNHSEIV